MKYWKEITVLLLAQLTFSESNQITSHLELKDVQDHGQLFKVLADLHWNADPEECTALTYGNVDIKFSHPFPMIHMAPDLLELAPSLNLGNCFFIFAPQHKDLRLLLEGLKETPKFIIRLLPGSDPEVPLRSPAESRIPQIYLVKNKKHFIYYNHCRSARVGMVSARHGKVIFKTREEKTHCLFRVGYNDVDSMFDLSSPTRANIDSREGFLLQTFIDKEELQAHFIFAGMTWGSYDAKTDSWNGLVRMAIEDKIDVGVCYIGFTHERAQVIDYTNYIKFSPNYFITKYPGLASPAGNLFRVFDYKAWLSILVSTAISCVILYFLMRYAYRIDTKFDFLDIIIYFNFTLASFPDLYIQKARFGRGSMMILLGVGLLALTVLAKAFGCNLNAILLKPVMMPPVETACDILNRNMKYMFIHGKFIEDDLLTSGRPCHWESAQNHIRIYEHTYEGDLLLVATDPTVVLVDGEEILMPTTLRNPKFEAIPKPWFHVSKEMLYAYYIGWILPKKSFIEERINRHNQLCHQAGFILHVERMYQIRDEEFKDQTQPMNLEHFLIGISILLSGYILSVAAFIGEKLQERMAKRSAQEDVPISPFFTERHGR